MRKAFRASPALGLIAALVWIIGCSNPAAPPPDPPAEPEIAIRQGAAAIGAGNEFDAGSIQVGVPKDIGFTIENGGSGALQLTGTPPVAVGGADGALFEITAQPLTPVDPAAETTFTVRFTPDSTGSKTAAVTVANNDPDEAGFHFTITAPGDRSGGAGNRGRAHPGGAVTGYGFGSIYTGLHAETTFRIENVGSADLILGSLPLGVTGDPAFTVTSQPASSSIAPAGYASFTVRFAPGSAGAKNATIAIASNDSDENPYTLALSGTGVAAPEMSVRSGAVAVADGGSYAFADTMAGGTAEVEFTIENTGTAGLNLTGTPRVAVSGSDFTVTADPATPVVAAGSTTFTIRFAPTATGLRTASISIDNDDPDEQPYNFTVSGTGTEWHGVKTVVDSGNVSNKTALTVSGGTVCIGYHSYQPGVNYDLRFAKSSDVG